MADAIRAVVMAALRRLWRSLATLPSLAGWRFAAVAAGATLAAMAAVGFSGGLYSLGRPDMAGLPLRLVSVIFIPALGEEAGFRGLLIPDRSESSRPWIVIGLVTTLFTLWHVIETLFLPGAARVFLRPDFLACAAILGLGCALIRWRTSSIWPAVALHWLVVVVWQTFLGGPGLDALR
ncbi:MAG: type II CAAX prenyl endopeptidase Rce1 family protein [Caulobacterales bacterium]